MILRLAAASLCVSGPPTTTIVLLLGRANPPGSLPAIQGLSNPHPRKTQRAPTKLQNGYRVTKMGCLRCSEVSVKLPRRMWHMAGMSRAICHTKPGLQEFEVYIQLHSGRVPHECRTKMSYLAIFFHAILLNRSGLEHKAHFVSS